MLKELVGNLTPLPGQGEKKDRLAEATGPPGMSKGQLAKQLGVAVPHFTTNLG